jgi:outer membrane lipoprotein-sorting protein
VLQPDETRLHILRDVLKRNYDRLKTLKGRAKMIVETPESAYSATSNITIKKPDSLCIKIEAALGIDVGWLLVDRRSFVLYTPRENRWYAGSTDSLKRNNLIAFEMTFERLLRAMAGMELVQDIERAVIRRDDSKIVVMGLNGEYFHKYWLDPYKGVITRAEVRDRKNRLIMLQEFERFVELAGVRIPRTIRMQRPSEKESMTLFYTRLKINGRLSKKDFALKIPESAEKIEL